MDSALDLPMSFGAAPWKKRSSISDIEPRGQLGEQRDVDRTLSGRCWRTHEKRPGVTRPLVHHTFSAQMRRG
jgi:hypothetical protein